MIVFGKEKTKYLYLLIGLMIVCIGLILIRKTAGF
jgi:LPXTG-motif cell wall-anchored protein